MGGHSVRCTFPAGLQPGRTASALIPTRIEGNVPHGTVLTGGLVIVTGEDDPTPLNSTRLLAIPVS